MAPSGISTIKDLQEAFMEIWGEWKDNHHLLASLNTIKRNENETIEEFIKRFNDTISSFLATISLPLISILIHFIEAFNKKISYQLRVKDPQDLKAAQTIVIKTNSNMQASWRSNLRGFVRGCASRSKPKATWYGETMR